jgi:hypothetical protein
MLKISSPVAAAAFVSTLLLSGAGTGLSIDSARADNCLGAPKAAAAKGQHWYYHVDRTSRRKCWYLHAAVQLRHRALIRHHAAATAAAASADPAPEPQMAAAPVATPEPSAPTPAVPTPMPDSAAGDSQPAPHVTVLAVRTATPFVSTTALPQQNTPEKMPAPPTPQTQLRDIGAPTVDGGKPADMADAAQPQGKADAAYAAPAQSADAATAAARTRTAEMFILLAFVFGIAAALIAIVSKIAGIYRKPRISEDPDAAWLRYRSARQRIDADTGIDEQDVPFLDPQEHYGLADLHAQSWADRPTRAPDEPTGAPHRNADFTQAQSGGPNLKGTEPALRVLQQTRQSRVA